MADNVHSLGPIPRVFLIGLLLCCASACTTNVSRFQMPGVDLTGIRALCVEIPDNRHRSSELLRLIEGNLEQRGYQLSTDCSSRQFGEGEFLFRYSADWHWDVTVYLLELRVAIYDPIDETLIAQAHSQQSSLARREMETVVDRAFTALFDEASKEKNGE